MVTALPVPLARSVVVTPFLAFLEAVGAPIERHLETAGLSPHLFEGQDSLVPLYGALHFVDVGARSEGLPCLGLLVGQRTRMAGLPPLAKLLSPEMTLREGISVVGQAVRLVSSPQRISLRLLDDKAILRNHLAIDDVVGRRHGDLYTLALLIDLIRLAAGPHWRPSSVTIPQSEACHREGFEELLETAVLPGSDGWAIAFDRHLLAAPLRCCVEAPADRAAMIEHLRGGAPADDFIGSLRQAVISLLPSGNASVEVAAKMAGLAVRTLQRRLSEAGFSYSQLLDEVRLQQARRLLRETDAKLVDVALELGYTDAANFSRAFRRWTGVSPQRLRRTHEEPGTPSLWRR